MTPLEQASRAAVTASKATGIPPELLVAQWAVESGWGKHAPGNNCFGIKQYKGAHGRQLLRTREWFTDPQLLAFLAMGDGRTATPTGQAKGDRREYSCQDWFATFPTLEACFERRAALFRVGRYKPFADQYDKDGDVAALIRGIAPIYATDPMYAGALLRVINGEAVNSALDGARGGGPIPA
jgi:flagellum-specific peptidoglycan hydrolase FlgJ